MENKIEKRNALSTVSMIMFMILMAAATAMCIYFLYSLIHCTHEFLTVIGAL